MAVLKLISAAVILTVLGECHGEYYGKLIGEFIRQGDTPDTHHNVSGMVYAVDDDTLQIIGFTFDGKAPDTFFFIGTTGTPSANGYVIPKAIGLGSEKLGAYNNEDLTIHLDTSAGPGSLSDYLWISVWCKQAGANFADVTIPLSFTPPQEYSLGRLGFNPVVHGVTADDVIILNSKLIRFVGLNYDGNGPDAYFWTDTVTTPTANGMRVPQDGESTASKLNQPLSDVTRTVRLPGEVFDIRSIGLWCVRATQNFGHVIIPDDLMSLGVIVPATAADDDAPDYDNCEVLRDDDFQVSWTIDGDDIAISLASRQGFNQYMAFGPSGSDSMTLMPGSDVTVAYIDGDTSMGTVDDYYLSAYSMCASDNGVCPDIRANTSFPGTNDVMLSGFTTDDGITRINYKRPLNATDRFDRAIMTTGPQYISWALGPINDDGLATYHNSDRTPGDKAINFGRDGSRCPAFTMRTDDDDFEPFEVRPIIALEDTEFRCDIGLSGGPKGYQGITGTVGWGIAWYIDDDLIPEITVKRNQTYTFKVYGGLNPQQSASYHPFYITTDPAGGYDQLPEAARTNHRILAGPVNGSYCIYEETNTTPDEDDIDSYERYRVSLRLNCPNGDENPGTLVWTPDEDTPDVVYYQCYTHRYLGWKINVSDDANKCVLSLITMTTSVIIAILLMARNV